MGLFRKREPTARTNEKEKKEILQMVTTWGENYYSWNRRL